MLGNEKSYYPVRPANEYCTVLYNHLPFLTSPPFPFLRYRERYWKKDYFDAMTFLKQVVESHGLNLVQVAFDWLQFHSKMRADRGDGILIGASSLKHAVQNLEALKNGKPLPKSVLEALDQCWEITRHSSPSYFRTKDQMMGAR